MASSPPAPPSLSLPNPRKRPAMTAHAATSQSVTKRPKLHPLRQTSFPIESTHATHTPGPRSENGSLTSGLSSKPSRRGRKAIQRARERDSTLGLDEDPATTSATLGAKSVISHHSAAPSAPSPAAVADLEDEAEYNPAELTELDRERQMEESRLENLKLTRLTSVFTREQERNYNAYRRVKLPNSVVRKIVNQTVSQSVTTMPLLAVSVYSKFFVGEIVERARDVQSQWARAHDDENEKREGAGGKRVPNPHAGALLPDHLREALRRYKADGEGMGVGMAGSSHQLLGVKGAGVWRGAAAGGGGRLFK